MEKIDYDALCKAIDTLAYFVGQQHNKTEKEIHDFLDGLGMYYNVDHIEHWPDMIKDIIESLGGS